MDEDEIPLLHARARHQRGVGRRRRDHQAGGVKETPSLGHGAEPLFRAADVGGVAALRGAENAVADGELGVREGGRDGEDGAGELGAGDPGEGGLVLVFAADLEQVEEVGGGGVDGEEVLCWRGRRGGEGGDQEVGGRLWNVSGELGGCVERGGLGDGD